MLTVLVSGLLCLIIFTGFFSSVFSPGWLSRIVVCDEEAGSAAWTPLLNQSVDRWSCAAACAAAHAGTNRSFFRNSAQCLCAGDAEMEAVTVTLSEFPECFDDVFVPDSEQSQSQSGSWGDLQAEDSPAGYARGAWQRANSLDTVGGHRSAQLLHAKLVLVRYWVSEATVCQP